MAFDAGSLFLRMEMRDKQFTSALDKIETQLKDNTKAMDKMEKETKEGFSAMGRSAAFFGVAVSKAWDMATMGLSFLINGIKSIAIASVGMAGDAGEIGSKFDVVFGDQTDRATAALEEFGSAVGRSRNDLKKMAGDIQNTFVPVGFARDQATDLSIAVTKLAVDLASFGNSSDTEALESLQSALIGNHETVRKYGVIITETTLNAKLMAMGIAGGTAAASEQQKVMARLQIIMEGTKDAQGDAERTADSWANTQKRLGAVLSDMGVVVGSAIIPSLTIFTEALIDIVKWANANKTAIEEWGAYAATWASYFVDAIGAVIEVVGNFDLYWKMASLTVEEVMTGMWERTVWFADNAWIAIEWFFTNFWEIASKSAQNYIQMWVNVGENFGTIVEAMWEYVSTAGASGGDKLASIMVDSMTKGMQQVTSSPEYKEFVGTDFSKRWDAHAAEWGDRMNGMAEETKAVGNAVKKDLDLKGMMSGLEGKTAKIQAKISGSDDLFKQNLLKRFEKNDAQKQVKLLEDNKLNQEKLLEQNKVQHKEMVDAVKGIGASVA